MAQAFFNLDPIEPNNLQIQQDRIRLRLALFSALVLTAGIWLVWLCAAWLGWSLTDLGIRPRQLEGLIGIATAPLAHGSFSHLVSNTLPLVVLASLALYSYPRAIRYALPSIWLGSGLGVWMFARPSSHIGISGVIHGLMFFLFLTGLLRRDRRAIAIALGIFFLYGGMLLTVLPREPEISWEYHLYGAIFGIIAAVFLYRMDAIPAPKKYSWDLEATPDYPETELELSPPSQVPILWHGPRAYRSAEGANKVLPFAINQRKHPSRIE